ncbi:hypothetical protein GCM10010449_75080 [Streptomyces rectiviolaceus]|uniref:Uncharacterized protein n=1 Tax=Streptomyces rectiviolaceus TaxID=332591 RepID=A0ABP6NFW0_9ACTN
MGAAYAKCYDPSGARYGVPTFPWRLAPDGLAPVASSARRGCVRAVSR